MTETSLSPEMEDAIEGVTASVRRFFHRYHKALTLAASITLGIGGAVGVYELNKSAPQETHAAEQARRPGETQMETTSAVAQEIGSILHTNPPKDAKDLDLLIEQHLRARIQRFGQDHSTGQGSDLKTYISVTRGHLGAELIAAAQGGDLTFALRSQPLLREQVSPMELCAYADNPAEAVTQFNVLVRSTDNRVERQRRIADALDGVAEIDTDVQDEDAYERFTRRLAVHMTNVEAGSATGRNAMHNLADELVRGFHQQEADAMDWDRGEHEDPTGHLESIRVELGRIHQAERHFGITASVPVSRIDRAIAQAEQDEN